MTKIKVIRPYKYDDQWVFDDERTGLVREPFVAGADKILDLATAGIHKAAEGFLLLFSASPFPEHQIQVTWLRAESDGNVYYWAEREIEGWLCPALLQYFAEPPQSIYFLARPCWHSMENSPRIERKSKPKKCPECGHTPVARILYGLPNFSDELRRQLDAGEIELGGCCIEPDSPSWRCSHCGVAIYRKTTSEAQ